VHTHLMTSDAARLNITRDEAQARARLLAVDSYDVTLDLTLGEVTFPSTTVARFRCSEPGATTFVDIVADEIIEAELNGRALDIEQAYEFGIRCLTDALDARPPAGRRPPRRHEPA